MPEHSRIPGIRTRAERQLQGIAKAKAAGVTIDATRVPELKAGGLGPSEIAKTLKIGRASVYRVLNTTAT
jgi:DNA invertase Pin-like site-specific DNA recombinase